MPKHEDNTNTKDGVLNIVALSNYQFRMSRFLCHLVSVFCLAE